MNRLDPETVTRINSSLFFRAAETRQAAPAIRPWQYLQMEYERAGLMPPLDIPHFSSIEHAQIWMCLDEHYNTWLRELSMPAAG